MQAAKEFIGAVNRARLVRGAGPLSWATAVKFLMARKFDVGRGLSLYEQHEGTRVREGLVRFDPTGEPLRTELETGKFTVLVILKAHCASTSYVPLNSYKLSKIDFRCWRVKVKK